MYSEKLMGHFNNPRNTLIIDDADGVGTWPTRGNQERIDYP